MAALRSFFKYVEVERPEYMLLCQKIVNLPYAKKERAAVNYLTIKEMTDILNQPNQATTVGRRDICFLSLLYDIVCVSKSHCALALGNINPGRVHCTTLPS